MNNLTITFVGTGQDPRTRVDKCVIIFNDNAPLFLPKEEFGKLLSLYANQTGSLQPQIQSQEKVGQDFYVNPEFADESEEGGSLGEL